MSIMLDLPEELESELATEATQLGLSLTEYVLCPLSTRSLVGRLPTTGAELVAYWQREGVMGTRPDLADSHAHARQIRHQAERRLQEWQVYLLDTDVLIDIQRAYGPALHPVGFPCSVE